MAIPCCKNTLGTVCLWSFVLKTRDVDIHNTKFIWTFQTWCIEFTSTGGFHLMVLRNLVLLALTLKTEGFFVRRVNDMFRIEKIS